MKARHFVRTRLALAVLSITIPGCQFSPSGTEAPAATAAPPAVAQPMAMGDASAATEQAAQTPAVATPPSPRSIRQPPPAPSRHTASTVEWLDPSDLRLSPTPLREPAQVAMPPSPATRPAVVVAAPTTDDASASKFAAIEEADSSANTPLVVPEGYEIATAIPPSATAPVQPVSPSAPATTAAAPPQLLDQRLSQRLRDNPRDVAAHLEYQLLQFLRDEPVPQASAIASLPAEDREVLTAVLDGLSNFRNGVRADGNLLLSRKVQPILAMAERVRSQADLALPTIMLCTKVDGFGIYDPIDPARFIAGREHPAIIYCEVANFASRLNDNRRWETQLRQEAVLYTESGLSVWQDKTRTITDLSRNRRHDFFIVKLVRLPANLTIGRYFLKVTVVDQQANRVAEATVSIQIVAE